MRVFETKYFARFARKNNLSHRALCHAVDQISKGLIDADLGHGLIKQRVARPGAGKSGSFRTILAYRSQRVAFFVYGFAKNDLANVDASDLADLYDLAAKLLPLSDSQLNNAVKLGTLTEVTCHGEKVS